MQRTLVWSLVGELQSHRPQSNQAHALPLLKHTSPGAYELQLLSQLATAEECMHHNKKSRTTETRQSQIKYKLKEIKILSDQKHCLSLFATFTPLEHKLSVKLILPSRRWKSVWGSAGQENKYFNRPQSGPPNLKPPWQNLNSSVFNFLFKLKWSL